METDLFRLGKVNWKTYTKDSF